MESKRAIAKRLLVSYFDWIFKKSGLHWNTDNIEEVEAIVDNIIDATIEEIRDEEIRGWNPLFPS